MKLFGILFLAILCEALISYASIIVVKDENDKKIIKWKVIASIIIGIGLAYTMQVDLFDLVGYEVPIPYVGIVLSGIIGSRGSNYVYDIWKKITGAKTQANELSKQTVFNNDLSVEKDWEKVWEGTPNENG